MGDIHAGTTACAEEAIRRRIKEISDDPFALWVGMGDYAECILPNDFRWDTELVADWVKRSNIAESQRLWVRDLFKPIADKCLGLLTGNHEDSIRRRNYQDIHLDLCRDLGVPNLGFSCFYRLFFSSSGKVTTVTCHFSHGAGGAQTEGGKVMRLAKYMLAFDADITGIGHLHDIKIDAIPMLWMDDGFNIKQKVRVGALTGSWFKAYSESPYPTYAERKGLSPTNLGCPHFTIKPFYRIIGVSGGP